MQQSKLLGVLTSRKAWAAIIGIGLTLGIDYFQGVDPEWIVGAITLIVGVYTGSVVRGIGARYASTTSSPSMIGYRSQSKVWKTTKKPALSSGSNLTGKKNYQSATTRYVASFEYVGPALDKQQALALWA